MARRTKTAQSAVVEATKDTTEAGNYYLSDYLVFGLSGATELTNNICRRLKIDRAPMQYSLFADGEIYVRPDVSVRQKNVVLIQSTSNPVNERLMELLLTIDACRRASAKSIIALIPYFGYARQDRKAKGREPISAKLVADLICNAGASLVALTDIHSEQAQGFFASPVDTLRADQVMLCHLLCEYPLKDIVIVSPDYGGVKRARTIAETLNVPIAIVDKRRTGHNKSQSLNVLGSVANKTAIIADDMIDTGGTMLAGCELLKRKGAKNIIVMATHALFNGDAVNRFRAAIDAGIINRIYITNSITPSADVLAIPKLKVVPLDFFYSRVITSYVHNESISCLYNLYRSWIHSPNLKQIIADIAAYKA